MRIVLVIVLFFFSSASAYADVGNCWFAKDAGSDISVACEKILFTYVYKAHMRSADSDMDLFVLIRRDREMEQGVYAIRSLDLTPEQREELQLPWEPSLAFEVAAADSEGLLRGVFEIGQALSGGTRSSSQIGRLMPGVREGVRQEPLLRPLEQDHSGP